MRTDRQALVHLLMLASLRDLVVRGPLVKGRHAYVLVRDWLGGPGRLERDRALADLALVGCGNPVLMLRCCIRGLVRRADLDARHGLVAVIR